MSSHYVSVSNDLSLESASGRSHSHECSSDYLRHFFVSIMNPGVFEFCNQMAVEIFSQESRIQAVDIIFFDSSVGRYLKLHVC